MLAVLALGVYASWLNRQYYSTQAPFFDSAAYTNYLARIVGTTQITGAREGLAVALEATTAPLPGLETWLLASLHVPISSFRLLGIWLQEIWVLTLALSLYFYWLHGRGRGAWTSALLTLPFLSFAGIFHFNGGLPDYRLDLALYLLLSTAAVWYLRTYSSQSPKHWLLAGAFLAFASVNRATAPVYWIIIVGPLLLVRFFTDDKRRLLMGIAWMILPVLIAAVPYFLFQFSFLYYYYAEWNLDANAHLSWQASSQHLLFALQHLGAAMLVSAAFFCLALLFENRTSLRLADVDWKALYMGFAPVLFLVARGAGLNPFVSLPAVFGWLLFLLAPLRRDGPALTGWPTRFAGALVLAACLWNAIRAPGQVAYPETRMAVMRQAIDWMREDAARRKLPRADFVTLHNWNFHPDFVRNVLIHEYGYRAARWSLISPEGVPWDSFHVWKHQEASYGLPFTANVALIWRGEIPGETDDEKIGWLLATARKDIDYIFIPDDSTIDFMEKYIAHNFINTKVRKVKKAFLESGEWQKIGTPLAITDFERVELYVKK